MNKDAVYARMRKLRACGFTGLHEMHAFPGQCPRGPVLAGVVVQRTYLRRESPAYAPVSSSKLQVLPLLLTHPFRAYSTAPSVDREHNGQAGQGLVGQHLCKHSLLKYGPSLTTTARQFLRYVSGA